MKNYADHHYKETNEIDVGSEISDAHTTEYQVRVRGGRQ